MEAPIFKYLLSFLLCLGLFYYEPHAAVIYVPVALILVFIMGFFNNHIFKFGIERFSLFGAIILIMTLLNIKFSTGLNPSIMYVNMENYKTYGQLFTILDTNMNLFLKNINPDAWFFGVIYAPIIWMLNNEIFINRTRKDVFLESLRIERDNIVNTNKNIYSIFYILWILFALSINVIFFMYVLGCVLVIQLMKMINLNRFVYYINLFMIFFFAMILLYNVKFGVHYSIPDGLAVINYLHNNEKFAYWFLNFKAHKLLYIGVAYINILISIIAFVVEYQRVKFKHDIEHSINTKRLENLKPDDGLYIADLIEERKHFVLPDEELNTHVYVNATTGGGKTTLFMRIIKELKIKKMPVIYVEGKGDTQLIERMKKIADENGQKFRFFTFKSTEFTNDVSCYDFLGVGNRDEMKNKLLQLLSSAENEFYYERLVAFTVNVLSLIEKAIKKGLIKQKLDLAFIFRLIANDTKLIELVSLVGDDSEKQYFESIAEMKEKPHERLVNILTPIVKSNYGGLFDLRDSENVINLYNAILNNEIILFVLDSSSYQEETAQFGKLIIDDINATFSSLKNDGHVKNTLVFFDEFASYASKSIATSLAVHRSNGLHAIIGSQSLETVNEGEDGKIIVSAITSNCNTRIILRTLNQFDLEHFANIAGTEKDYAMTHQMDTLRGGDTTGMGSMRVGNKYKIAIEELRGLPTGVGYIYRVTTNTVKKIKVRM